MNIWITWIIWFVFGILGAVIYNSFLIYEHKSLKYIWDVIVIICGIFGFIFAVLHWMSAKLIK